MDGTTTTPTSYCRCRCGVCVSPVTVQSNAFDRVVLPQLYLCSFWRMHGASSARRDSACRPQTTRRASCGSCSIPRCSLESKRWRGFHWVAVMLAAVLLACGLVLITFDVRDLWHPDAEDIPPTSVGDLFLGVLGLLMACVTLWAAVRVVGWIAVRLLRRYENQQQPD